MPIFFSSVGGVNACAGVLFVSQFASLNQSMNGCLLPIIGKGLEVLELSSIMARGQLQEEQTSSNCLVDNVYLIFKIKQDTIGRLYGNISFEDIFKLDFSKCLYNEDKMINIAGYFNFVSRFIFNGLKLISMSFFGISFMFIFFQVSSVI